MDANASERDACWSDAIAVGSRPFTERIQAKLGPRAAHRDITSTGSAHVLREPTRPYRGISGAKNDDLSA